MDPLVDATGQPYAYTGDDPTDETDPTGLYGRIGRIASASAYGYFVAFNHVTTGNKQAVKPGMVRIQFQFTAQAAAPSTAYILAAIRDESEAKVPLTRRTTYKASERHIRVFWRILGTTSRLPE